MNVDRNAAARKLLYASLSAIAHLLPVAVVGAIVDLELQFTDSVRLGSLQMEIIVLSFGPAMFVLQRKWRPTLVGWGKRALCLYWTIFWMIVTSYAIMIALVLTLGRN